MISVHSHIETCIGALSCFRGVLHISQMHTGINGYTPRLPCRQLYKLWLMFSRSHFVHCQFITWCLGESRCDCMMPSRLRTLSVLVQRMRSIQVIYKLDLACANKNFYAFASCFAGSGLNVKVWIAVCGTTTTTRPIALRAGCTIKGDVQADVGNRASHMSRSNGKKCRDRRQLGAVKDHIVGINLAATSIPNVLSYMLRDPLPWIKLSRFWFCVSDTQWHSKWHYALS